MENMFEFRDGQQYSLSTESGSNKSVLFVKLTDSALHSIENFLHAKDEVTKPTIQFEGNNGTITVPQNGHKIFYGFTLSNLKADGSSFQCLQHATEKSLKCVTSMHIKMQVHANEDSYANTKYKMAAVEKEQKSLCTKEIKANGKCLSKKSIFKHPGGVFPIKAVPFVKAQEHSGFLKPREMPKNPMLSKEPIRKRVIHILAIKPFKKPDIMLKLMKDGISDEDKSSMPEILKEVAVCKGKVYTLSNHLWNEVEDNWKFYSKEELEIIHRKKQNYRELTGISTSKKQNYLESNGVPTCKSQKNVQKVNVNKFESLDEPQSKKQRLSLNTNHKGNKKKAGSSELNSVNTVKTNGILNNPKIPSPNQVNGHPPKNGLSSGKSSLFDLNTLFNGKSPQIDSHTLGYGKSPKIGFMDTLMKLHTEDTKLNTSNYESPDSPDCVSNLHDMPKLVKITSNEQRAEYAEHFNAMYTDYLELHKKLRDISGEILHLESQLNDCEKGSEEYEQYRKELSKIFKKTALNYQYKAEWERFHFYQKSLEKIKKLVSDYDNEAS